MINWFKRIAAPQDVCLSILEDLLNQGYTTVTWQQSSRPCSDCRRMNNKKWDLEKFIKDTSYNAAIFSKTHVGCQCTLLVEGPDLEDVTIDFRG